MSVWALFLAAEATPLFAAEITLPAVFSDHMALQQGMAVPIWGTAGAGESITVRFRNQTHKTTADAQGLGA
jgi:sialate O-acetylesterase